MSSLIVGHQESRRRFNPLVIASIILVIIFLALLAYILLAANQSTEPVKTTKQAATTIPPTIPPTTTSTTMQIVKKSPEPKPVKVVLAPVKVAQEKGVTVLEKVTSRQVVNNYPVKPSQEFFPGETVYFYTKIASEKIPVTIKHEWLDPQGQPHFIIDLPVYYNNSGTWSRISLPANSQGKWTVKIKMAGQAIGELSFRVK